VLRIGSPLTARAMGIGVVGWADGLAWPVYADCWLGGSLVDARVDARHEVTLFPRRRAGGADPYSQGASRSTMR